MKNIALLLIILICVIFSVSIVYGMGNSPKKAPNEPIKPAENVNELRIESGEKKNFLGLTVSVDDFKQVMAVREDGTRYEFDDFNLVLKKGNQTKTISPKYGEVYSFEGYSIKMKYCATGTRDWKSFAILLINK